MEVQACHQWLLLGVQACRLPGLHSLGMLHPAATRHRKATHQWLLMGVQACRLPSLKRLKPLKTLKTLQTLTTRQGVQACRLPGLKHSLGMLHPAANRHPKATHQWLLIGVQACRLPALKRLKPLKTLQTLKTSGRPSLPFAKTLKHSLGMLHPAANRHPKATHQCLLMGVQPCRLPALKRVKPLKTLKTFQTLTTRHGGPSLPFARPSTFPWHASSCSQPGTPRPHINGFLSASKPAVCQPLNA